MIPEEPMEMADGPRLTDWNKKQSQARPMGVSKNRVPQIFMLQNVRNL